MSDDFFFVNEPPPRRDPPVVAPLLMRHLFTLVALVLWIAFAIWVDLGGLIAALGAGYLLWLRHRDHMLGR